jgi:hypothetical protein
MGIAERIIRSMRDTTFGMRLFSRVFSKGVSTIAKATEIRKGDKRSAAYFIIIKSIEIVVTRIKN